MTRKGVSFAMQVLIVVIVIMIVALVVLSIFGGGIGNIGGTINQLMGGAGGGTACESVVAGARCVAGATCPPQMTISFGGSCVAGQICCIPVPSQ